MITIIVVGVVAAVAIFIITRKGKQQQAPKPVSKPVQEVEVKEEPVKTPPAKPKPVRKKTVRKKKVVKPAAETPSVNDSTDTVEDVVEK